MMMRHALRYASDGFAVFPVYEPNEGYPYGHPLRCSCGKELCRGKHPRTPNGCTDATTDVDTIKGWWTRWPKASIGIATGKRSGVAVVDLDGSQGIASGAMLSISSPITSLTGNGKQLWYADPEGKLKNSVKKMAEGLDTRGEGGYVVAPPSLHPNGKRYAWLGQPLKRSALPTLPIGMTTSGATQEGRKDVTISTIRKPDGWIAAALDEMRKGHVHNTLISVLGKFRAHNFSEEDTYRLLAPHALLDGRPYEALRGKISEIWKRYQPGPAVQGPARSESITDFLNDVKEVEWICRPFIAKKAIGLVAGLPETLKTWLCVDLAVESVQESGLWAGLFPVTNCKTLFIDQERSRDETQNRFNRVLAGKGIDRATLDGKLYIKCGTTIRINLDASYQAFRTELLEMRPNLVIVDSLKAFHTSAENDSTEMQRVFERLKELRNELGCTFLFIHHENKNAYPNGEPQGEPHMGTISGSGAIGAAPEFCLIVRKVEAGTSVVWHAKSTQAKKAKAFYASVVDVPEGIVVRGLND